MVNPISSERLKNVDFFRFIFAVMIVMYHCNGVLYSKFSNVISNLLPGVSHFNICVDFFFIISGFFLFKSLKKDMPAFEFMKNRFLRLAPLIWLYLLLDNNFYIIKLFLLNDIGFGPRAGTTIHWYVSVLFWLSLFYFTLAKVFEEKYLNLIIWIITVCSLGFCLNWSEFMLGGNYQNVFYFVNVGVLRGLFGMGIGYFVYLLYKSDFLNNINSYMKKFLYVFEPIIFFYFIGMFIFSAVMPKNTAFTYLILFVIIFFMFMKNLGILSKLLNKEFSVIIGSWSYAIYVMHPLVIKMFRQFAYQHKAFVADNTMLMFWITVATAVFVGSITHYLFEKPINKLFKKFGVVK